MPSRYARFLTLTLLLAFSGSMLWWHTVDTRPSAMDETRHMKLAMDYRAWVTQGVPLNNDWSHVYPPLYHFSIIPALSLGTPSESKVAATNFFYLIILIAGCVLLGRSAERPDWESVAAAFLCAGYAFVLSVSRRALIDFPLMTWVTLSMALLARTQGFSSRRASLWWGAVAGLGLLLKPPFAFFSLGPVLWVFATSRASDKTKNFWMALGLCLVIGVPWYFWQSAYFLRKAFSLAGEVQGEGRDPHTLSGWLFYLRVLRVQMGTFSLVFTLAGVVLALWRRRAKGDGLLILWFLSGYLILSALTNKDPRHTLPLLPVLAILAARGWGDFVTAEWGPYLVSAAVSALLILNTAAYDRPAREDWKHTATLHLLVQHHDTSQPFLLVSVLSQYYRFFARTLKWSAIQQGVDLQTVSAGDSTTSFAEYVITRPIDSKSDTTVLNSQWEDLRPQTRAFKELFSVDGRFRLPDQTEVIVYRREPHPTFHVSPLTSVAVEQRLAKALRPWVQGPLTVSVDATPSEIQEGRLRQVRISCAPCQIQGARVEKAELVVQKPWINLYRLWDENQLGLLAFESLKLTCQVHAADVEARLSQVKELSHLEVQFADNHVQVHARYRGIPVGAVAHVIVDNSRYARLEAVLDTISIGGVPLPGWLLGKAHRQILWLYPLPDFPGRILVNQVSMENGVLQIS